MSQDTPKLLTRLSNVLGNLALLLVRNKFKTLAIMSGLCLVLGSGLSTFKIDQSMEAFFAKDDPTLVRMNWFKYVFGSDEFIMIMYKPKDKDVFSEKSLRELRKLEDSIKDQMSNKNSPLTRITQVRSIVSADYLESVNDTLINREFIGNSIPTTPIAREALRSLALNHKTYPKSFISTNSEYGILLLKTDFGARIAVSSNKQSLNNNTEQAINSESEFDFDDTEVDSFNKVISLDSVPELERVDMNEYVPVVAQIDELLQSSSWKEHNQTWRVGNPIIMSFFNNKILPEISLFAGLSFLIIWLVMLFAYRSFSALVWPTVSLVLGVICTLGIIGWSGLEMTFMVNIIIFLLLSVSMATSIHLMSGFSHYIALGTPKHDAIKKTYVNSAVPVVLAGITTAIGLVALLFVPIPAINNFGLFAAIGVLVTLFINLILWPVFLELWAPAIKPDAESKTTLLASFLVGQRQRAYRNSNLIIAIFVLAAGVFGFGVSKVFIDTNFTQMIKSNEISSSYELIDKHFGGTTTAEILIDTGLQDGVKNSKLLKAIEGLVDELKLKHKIVTRATSLVNAIKDSYMNLNDGSDTNYIIPQTDDQVAQTLLSFESADPKTRKFLTDDNWQVARVTLSLYTKGTNEYSTFFKKLRVIVSKHINPLKKDIPDISVSYSGGIDLMTKLLNLVSISQIKSFSLALVTISIVLFLLFGSFKFGLLAMIPNIFPLVVVMGVAGWLGIPLDSDTLLVLPIAIGIAVDDSIHLLTHYRAERALGLSTDEALDSAIVKVGQAIVFTSVVLSCGFMIYILSLYKPLINFGFLSAIAILSALLADLFLLPVLIKKFGSNSDIKKTPKVNINTVALFFIILFWGLSSKSVFTQKFDANKIMQQSFALKEADTTYQSIVMISCGFKVVKNNKKKCSSSKRKKTFEMISKKMDPKGLVKKSLSIINTPLSEKGVVFLQEDYDDANKDSKQWMYLPALKKLKMIVSASSTGPKTGSLFGSEIAYEDIEKKHFEDYSYKQLKIEKIKSKDTYVIELTPTKKHFSATSYSRSVVWIDKESLMMVKSDSYDKQNILSKTFTIKGIELRAGVWISKVQIIVNHKNKRMSMMKSILSKINKPISKELLSPRALSDKDFLKTEINKLR